MPYDQYSGIGSLRGHYKAAQASGALAATIGAAGHLASIRWSNGSAYCVLKRLRVGIGIISAVTTAVETTLQAVVVRGFTVDFTTAITAVAPSRMRSLMPPSLIAGSGTKIATTTVMSGQTLTADAAPFAIAVFPMLTPVTATGTAVALPAGAGTVMQTLYEQTADGDHPVVLSQDEGVVVQTNQASVASGTWRLYVQWEWAELNAY